MNPFAALESDDEDETFTKVQSNKKADSKKPVQANNATVPVAVTVNNSDKKSAVGGRGGGGRGDNRNKGRGAGRGGKETGERKNGKREFDRKSGTGRGTEVAKGGAGKGGWGTNEEEIVAQRRELEEGADAAAVDAKELKEKKVEVVEEPVEPEAPTFSFDEFLARRDAERAGSSIFKKVEERVVSDDYSKFKKSGGEELQNFVVLGAGKAKGPNDKSQRSSAATKVTNLGFHSAPKEEYREDRGDRGGKGDRGGRGGDRPERGADRGGKGGRGGRGGGDRDRRAAPRAGGKVDISDTSAFPSL